jgi:hypothetical protein
MPAKNGNADIARQYRTKYPDMPTLKLARIMYKENNLAFLGVTGTRTLQNQPSLTNLSQRLAGV